MSCIDSNNFIILCCILRQSQICKCTKLKRLFLSGKKLCLKCVCYRVEVDTYFIVDCIVDNNLTFEGIPPQIGKLQNLVRVIQAGAAVR